VAELDPPAFRQLLGRFATGVSVLTTVNGAEPIGMTANSLASVSLVPPLLSVCVDRQAEIFAPILAAPYFVVNVLSEGQEELSRRFATTHGVPFDGVGYHLSERGLVLLDGAIAHIECAREAAHPAGDHVIVVGRVVGGAAHDGRPLLFYRGGYASLG
jgi:flavin reductase (DIM6/NTAB) family NADH-FMN oxidoreductase RutF